MSLLLDAEQTHRQPAIDYIALRLMREFNTRDKGCVVYNTYQVFTTWAQSSLVVGRWVLSLCQDCSVVIIHVREISMNIVSISATVRIKHTLLLTLKKKV